MVAPALGVAAFLKYAGISAAVAAIWGGTSSCDGDTCQSPSETDFSLKAASGSRASKTQAGNRVFADKKITDQSLSLYTEKLDADSQSIMDRLGIPSSPWKGNLTLLLIDADAHIRINGSDARQPCAPGVKACSGPGRVFIPLQGDDFTQLNQEAEQGSIRHESAYLRELSHALRWRIAQLRDHALALDRGLDLFVSQEISGAISQEALTQPSQLVRDETIRFEPQTPRKNFSFEGETCRGIELRETITVTEEGAEIHFQVTNRTGAAAPEFPQKIILATSTPYQHEFGNHIFFLEQNADGSKRLRVWKRSFEEEQGAVVADVNGVVSCGRKALDVTKRSIACDHSSMSYTVVSTVQPEARTEPFSIRSQPRAIPDLIDKRRAHETLARSEEQPLFEGALCFWNDVDHTFPNGVQNVVKEVQRVSLGKNGHRTLEHPFSDVMATATSSSATTIEAFLARYGMTPEESIITFGGLICF